MFRRGCSVAVGSILVVLLASRLSFAQDDASRDKEIQELKRRLDMLELERAKDQEAQAQQNQAPEPGAAMSLDPLEEKWFDRVKVGGGVRASFDVTGNGSHDGHGNGYNFVLESGRLYTSGKVNDWISGTLNAEWTSSLPGSPPGSPAQAGVLDAIAEFKLMKDGELNVWMGRMLPACDRSNSDGPYYLTTWSFPVTSVAFNNETNGFGRTDGVTIWGDVGKFKYWVGAYEGIAPVGTGTAIFGDHLSYAARLQYDFFDPETGYYLSSTYYGKQRTLAIAIAANGQEDAFFDPVHGHMVGSMNFEIDILYEDKLAFLGGGVLTVEGDYYRYQRGGLGGPGGGLAVTPPALGFGQGDGCLILIAFLVPGQVGPGQFQPHIRYQGFNEEAVTTRNPEKNDFEQIDIGVNYVMEGHNARITLVYSSGKNGWPTGVGGPARDGFHEFTVGGQVQF
jgi:hypothetical protein